MKIITLDNKIENYVVTLDKRSSATSERADLIQQFVDKLNQGLDTTKYKKKTFRQINGQLRYCSVQDLYIFFKECETKKNFAAFFWWKVKHNSWGKVT